MFLAISLVLVNQISHIFLGEEMCYLWSVKDNGCLGNQDKHCFCEIYCY